MMCTYTDAVAITDVNIFGRGTGPIHIANVGCSGQETRLLDCIHDTSTVDCSHFLDVGVRCNANSELTATVLGRKGGRVGGGKGEGRREGRTLTYVALCCRNM